MSSRMYVFEYIDSYHNKETTTGLLPPLAAEPVQNEHSNYSSEDGEYRDYLYIDDSSECGRES